MNQRRNTLSISSDEVAHSEASRNKFIITGGPGFGITTIVNTLAGMGFHTVREAARYVIDEEMNRKSSALPWQDRDAFDRLLCRQKVTDYFIQTNNKPLFFDRGLPDFVGWRNYLGRPIIELWDDIVRHPYEKTVFMTMPWKEIYEQNGTRPISYQESEDLHAYLMKGYEKLGYQVFLVPKTTPENRAHFVLNTISSIT